MSAGTQPGAGGSVLALPIGGGAIRGVGEKFAADPFTGTGRFSVPIQVPPGRHGVQPDLAITWSGGHGNGLFGAGWQLGLPVVSRRTAKGVPRYDDTDVFVLAGAEDLVPVGGGRYRPRTEGLFARIERAADGWTVRTRDGLTSRYATPVTDSADAERTFAWKITGTADLLGNRVRYDYGDDDGQPMLATIAYADYGSAEPARFLISVELVYDDRPDPFTDNRAGFAIRTTKRCRTIRIVTHASDGVERIAKEYRFGYSQAAFNGMSLLTRVDVVGIDGDIEQAMAPITFEYSELDAGRRRFRSVGGLDGVDLRDPGFSLVDVRGVGLPDVVELRGTVRHTRRNAGNGRYEAPRLLSDGPPASLVNRGVQLLDADGDGRPDLLTGDGYFPMRFGGGWSSRSFRAYPQVPTGGFGARRSALIDLDGDGLTDVLRTGDVLEAWFNAPDPAQAWRRSLVDSGGPDVDLDDPRVRLADMTGDGLQDIVVVHSGSVTYHPNLGHGRFGESVVMRPSPRLPDGYDPGRVLLGDVDGDGAADLVYIDDGRVMLWANRMGAGFADTPIVVGGTPAVTSVDTVRLADLNGTGMAGVLYNRADRTLFLDIGGGVKAHLLTAMDNHMGAVTRVTYRPSTAELLRDRSWHTTLPFPVHLIARIEVSDALSDGQLTTEYRYHHGYWDGVEREYRGFAMVEQVDADLVGGEHHSPPTLTKTWFHPGPVAADETAEWTELDLTGEHWPGDPSVLERPPAAQDLLAGLDPAARRTALRALRGQVLRTELYALDGTDRAERPYTVTESVQGLRREADGVFFPCTAAVRTTQWERGDEPATTFAFHIDHDRFGLETRRMAMALGRRGGPLLATTVATEYAQADEPDRYMVDRVARTTIHEIDNDGGRSAAVLRDAVVAGQATTRLIGDVRNYYDGEPFAGLPLGDVGRAGMLTRAETLAFDDGFLAGLEPAPPYLTGAPWTAEYPAGFRNGLAPLAGYRRHDGGYWVTTGRHRYSARGLVVETLDPMGASLRVDFDEHDLLAVTTTDSVGLATTGQYDLRLLQVHRVTDPNGNVSEAELSPLGMPTAQFVRGRPGASDGDTEVASIRRVADLAAFDRSRQPASVTTVRRTHHEPGRGTELTTVEYSDGFGRLLQTRAQAEDVLFGDPVFGRFDTSGDALGTTRSDRVVVSGWQIYDNKGRAVHKYEPFFSTGSTYARPGDAQLGRRATAFYDPRGVVVRTVSPDGSESRIVHGVPDDPADPARVNPTPWESYQYDANDNAGRTHPTESAIYRDHWNTPSSVELDGLGRTVRSVARNGSEPADWLTTTTTYDIVGNVLTVTDSVGRTVFAHRYDRLQRAWSAVGIDSGRRITIHDALGRPIEHRDANGALTLHAFDAAQRPTAVWARDRADRAVTMRQRIEHGDDGDRHDARARNLLGRVRRHYDEAGVVVTERADFKGNPLETVRHAIADGPILARYEAATAVGWDVEPFSVDWTDGDAGLLDPTPYATTADYDALNRMTRQLLPVAVDGTRHELAPVYGRAGGLVQVRLDGRLVVERIADDAKGQRTLIAYGNGVMTRYGRDPLTFRLTHLRSERYAPTGGAEPGYRPAGGVLQDERYEHDAHGNVLAIHDRVDAPFHRRFRYDPIYRLVSATGREHDQAVGADPWTDRPRGTDLTRTQRYAERYTYDSAGNLQQLVHTATGGFTRTYDIDRSSNRLHRATVGSSVYEYAYDANGNMVAEATSRRFEWDHADRLVAFATQTRGAEPSIHAHYLYDASGQRVVKFVRHQGGTFEVTRYIGDVFEHHRWTGVAAGANNRLAVMDDHRPIAVVRVGDAHPDDRGPAVGFHLGDHLGSCTVVIDESGTLVNREEFTPYGETSFGSYGRKRYRFCGRERDEESGLAYHSARYYSPWTGRWTSCDPTGPASGTNLYQMCGGDPMNHTDTTGTDWEFTWDPREWEPWEFTKEEIAPRAFGGVKTVGGLAAMGGGLLLCETGVGCLVGAPLMAAGADVGGSGLSQVWHGSPQPTVIGQFLGPEAQQVEENVVAAAGMARMAGDVTSYAKTGKVMIAPNKPYVPAKLPTPTRPPAEVSPGQLAGLAASSEAKAVPWKALPGGVRIKQVGPIWIKEVNPAAGGVARSWGRGSLDAQAKALGKLGDMAPAHSYVNGQLVIADAGSYVAGSFWSTWLKGSWRLGTPFNDIRMRNIGGNQLIFDPAKHPAQQTLEAVGAAALTGGVGWSIYDAVTTNNAKQEQQKR